MPAAQLVTSEEGSAFHSDFMAPMSAGLDMSPISTGQNFPSTSAGLNNVPEELLREALAAFLKNNTSARDSFFASCQPVTDAIRTSVHM